ncbi:transcription factor GTE6-like isoform X4 [Gossypium arboreum]|nr:transcription factor GTE6-like isoform X4 [Gossypium arboreum]
METVTMSTPDIAEVDQFRCRVDEIFQKVDKLEKKVNEVEQFYLNANKKKKSSSKGNSIREEQDKGRHVPSIKKQQQDASQRESAAAKRMQELMRQFGTILRQISQHKWAWPFMQPVDVKGLGLHDYYKVIEKPMDLGTIKNQMEAKDGTGYKNVRAICADVRLVFDNAMKYNEEGSDVHLMAKTLLEKFEEKWQLLLPKVTEEEKRREEEEAEAQLNMQLVREASHAKKVQAISNELYEVDTHLEQLRETVVQKCSCFFIDRVVISTSMSKHASDMGVEHRKMSTKDKRNLGAAIARLSTEDLNKALEIIAQSNPGLQAMAEEVEIDIDAQSESTLWRLNFFVKDVFEGCDKSTAGNKKKKRKKEICDAIAQTVKKKSKKPSS